jgi:nitrate/nitrite transport system ATP-binding protein
MLTNGPEAHIGQILEVPIPRPRKRMEVVNHPSYYSLRNEIIYFLNQQKRAKKRKIKTAAPAIARYGLEKVNLEIGFIGLTDCAPLVVAQELGFFRQYGLEEVLLRREPSWKAIVDGIETGGLDAAQMVAGMPLSMTLGLGGKDPMPTVTSLVLSRNGNAITIKRSLYERGAQSLGSLKSVLKETPEQRHTFGVVHPASMHNLLLRYWLASGNINPDQDVNLTVIPPAQMVANLKAGNIDGYCVGEPWNTRAVLDGDGVVLATDIDIWPSHPEKVLGVREDWIEQHPKTHMALVRALIEACEYCDDRRNRSQIVELLSQNKYVGVAPEYIRPGFLDPYDAGTEHPASILRFNQFFVDHSPCPTRAEGLWILTQFARWGLTPFPKNWVEITERVRRFDLYGQAARELGLPDAEPDLKPFALFDGIMFNPNTPLDYLNQFNLKVPVQVQEILIDSSKNKAA